MSPHLGRAPRRTARPDAAGRRRTLLAVALSPFAVLAATSHAGASPGPGRPGPSGRGIPAGYGDVDPRTALRVPLWQPLDGDVPVFPGDPPFAWETFTTIEESGYLLERITSLGTHTGTHISAPGHFVEGGRLLDEIGERLAMMPLAVVDVAARVVRSGGDFSLDVDDLRRWEQRHGRFPEGGAVLLHTGFSAVYSATRAAAVGLERARATAGAPTAHPEGSGPASYFDPAPGLTGKAVAWLFERRRIHAVGSDTFGPDATADTDFSATSTALQQGGITIENVGAGLARMRAHGDWIAVNGARPHFSGFAVGITGFTTG